MNSPQQHTFRLAVFGLAMISGSVALAPPAQAHAIWFAQRAGELALVYGHGAEDLSVIQRIDKVTSVGGVGASGQPVNVTLKRSDHLAFAALENAPATVTATLDNGFWSEGPDGKWVNKSKDEVPGAKRSGRYFKYSVHLRELPRGEAKPVADMVFQLVPISATFPLHAGQPLTLRVLLNGKPAVGAKVWPAYVNNPDQAPLTVARDGSVTVKLANQGLNVIKAEVDVPPADAAKADKTEHTTTLSFVLPHKPE